MLRSAGIVALTPPLMVSAALHLGVAAWALYLTDAPLPASGQAPAAHLLVQLKDAERSQPMPAARRPERLQPLALHQAANRPADVSAAPLADRIAADEPEVPSSIPAADPAPVFYPASGLARPPVPVSAPDPRHYLGTVRMPLWQFGLRLYIRADGQVDAVTADTELLPPEVLAALTDMFRATPFIPAHDGRHDVASYIDIRISPEL